MKTINTTLTFGAALLGLSSLGVTSIHADTNNNINNNSTTLNSCCSNTVNIQNSSYTMSQNIPMSSSIISSCHQLRTNYTSSTPWGTSYFSWYTWTSQPENNQSQIGEALTYDKPSFNLNNYKNQTGEALTYDKPSFNLNNYKNQTGEALTYDKPSFNLNNYKNQTGEALTYDKPSFNLNNYKNQTGEALTYDKPSFNLNNYKNQTGEALNHDKPSFNLNNQASPVPGYNAPEAKWKDRVASVYIDTNDQEIKQAILAALNNWNKTGAFHFYVSNNPNTANIRITTNYEPNSTYDGNTETYFDRYNRIYHGQTQITLNNYFLKNPNFNYSFQHRVHTIAHELGHAIGLQHNPYNHNSIMYPQSTESPIQPTDVQEVNYLYSK